MPTLLEELRRPEAVLSEPYKTLGDLCREAANEIERLRAVLGAIARTVFSGDEMSEDYQRGNREAHETCARVALGALGRTENKDTENARRTR